MERGGNGLQHRLRRIRFPGFNFGKERSSASRDSGQLRLGHPLGLAQLTNTIHGHSLLSNQGDVGMGDTSELIIVSV